MNRFPKNRPYVQTAAIFLLCSVATLFGQATKPAAASDLIQLKLPAPSLAGNLLGDPTTQPVYVYLPPSYKTETSRRFPTLYVLHGYTGRPEEWVKDGYQGMNLQAEMDSLIAKGVAAEM